MPPRSLLPVVAKADNFPLHPNTPYPTFNPINKERYIPFHLTFADYHAANIPPLGLIRPSVLAELQLDERGVEECPWQFVLSGRDHRDGDEEGTLDLEVDCVFFAHWVILGGKEVMERVMRETAEGWRTAGKFDGALGGWRDELYQIYASPQSSYLRQSQESQTPFRNGVFGFERSACAIFGFPTFGVHLTAYEGEGEEMKIWVPRRSATKATWPSRLDNSVAGGIPAGMRPLEAMIKECDEEASLPEDFVRKRIKNAGLVTYCFITDDGYLQPELEYIYDLPLPPRSDPSYILPHPHDDEVESFALLSIAEVIDALHSGEFKPNCGLILVDFLIRHGFVTPENEPAYMEICWRMHRRLGVAVPA